MNLCVYYFNLKTYSGEILIRHFIGCPKKQLKLLSNL